MFFPHNLSDDSAEDSSDNSADDFYDNFFDKIKDKTLVVSFNGITLQYS